MNLNKFHIFANHIVFKMLKIMKILYFLFLISLFTFTFLIEHAKASHIKGSDLTFKCVGKDSFLLNLNVYRKCGGLPVDTSVSLLVNSSCGSFNTTLNRGMVYDATPVCKSSCSQCDSTSCSFPYGIEKNIYSGLLVLPQNSCCVFTLSWTACCRTSVSTISSTSEPMYIEAKLNRCIDPCNNSPKFTDDPITIVCKNRDIQFYQKVTEAEGDSLVFSLTSPLKTNANIISYDPPYSYSEPLDCAGCGMPFPGGGFHIDSKTGTIRFRPTTEQTSIISTLIREYRSDTLLSEVRRDLIFMVIDCPNNNPPIIDPPFNFEVCANSEIKIPVTIWDPDSTGSDPDSVFLDWNNAIHGAKFEADSALIRTIGDFSWTPSQFDATMPQPHSFIAVGHDNACPLNNYTSRTFNILVNPQPQANVSYYVHDTAECGRVDFSVEFIDGSYESWNWSGAGGLNSNDSIHTHYYPSGGIYPFTLTIYSADSCKMVYTDTLLIPDFPTVDIGNDLDKCQGDLLEIEAASYGGTGLHTYLWSTGDTNKSISREMIFFPDTNYIDSENYELTDVRNKTLIIEVKDEQTCINRDTIVIKIRKLPEPDLEADTRICEGTIYELNTDYPEYIHEWFEISNPSEILSTSHTYSVDESGTYIVKVIDTSFLQCSNFDTINLIVDPLTETPHVIGPDKICEADSAVYVIDNYNSEFEYFWMCSGLTECDGATGPNALIKFTGSGNASFDVYVNSPHGCGIESYTKDVNVSSIPEKPVLSGQTEVCEGDFVLITIDNFDPSLDYIWNCTGSANCENETGYSAMISFNSADSSFIEVIATSSENCGVGSQVYIVNVKPEVVKPIVSGPLEVCENDTVDYVIDNFDPLLEYFWKCSGSAECIDTNGSNARILFKSSENALIEVFVSSAEDCGEDSVLISILVNPLAVLPIVNGPTEVCAGDSVNYTIVNYDPLLNYEWICSGSAVCESFSGNSVWVNINDNEEEAFVEVKVSSAKSCGEEQSLLKVIKTHVYPERPLLSGPAAVNEASTETYLIANTKEGVSYTWQCFGSAECSSDAMDENEVNFNSACSDALIEIKAQNFCGSNTITKAILIEPEKTSGIIPSIISVIIFPNPSQGEFYLRLRTRTIESLNIEIYNDLGKIIFKKQYRDLKCDTELPLSINNYASGSYYLILKTEEGELTKKILIK